MRFVLTFPWRGFVLAVRGSDRPNKNEVSISVFGVTAKDFSHVPNLEEASLAPAHPEQLNCSAFSGLGSGAKFQRYAAVRRQ
jgi:hypothetical protein